MKVLALVISFFVAAPAMACSLSETFHITVENEMVEKFFSYNLGVSIASAESIKTTNNSVQIKDLGDINNDGIHCDFDIKGEATIETYGEIPGYRARDLGGIYGNNVKEKYDSLPTGENDYFLENMFTCTVIAKLSYQSDPVTYVQPVFSHETQSVVCK